MAQLYPETPTRAPASVSAPYLDNPWAPEPQGPLSPLQTPAHFPPAESTYLRTGTYQPTGFHTPVPLSPALPTVLEQMETESTDHSGSEPAEIRFLRNQTQLTEAIHLMARNMSNMPMMQPRQEPTPRPKLKAPDVFDGTSAQKLDPFLVQCMMYILLRPHEFTTKDSKVGFIMSYLSGSPYNWFPYPTDYHEFPDVFSKSKADTLAPHRPYDLKIDLEEGAEPPLGRMYSLSPTELQALREFLEENTRSKIADGDEWKTTFRTRYGSFEWRVMPFGLSNAPAAFQRFMNDIFSDLIDISVIVYLDDILIYSSDLASHKEHVKEVLRRLRKYGLYARPDKCEWHTDRVEYLGYILLADGLSMAADKFNLIVRFRPGKLGAKPDALTRRWDVYLKEGGSNYATVNPHNFRPVFTQEQLATSLRASTLITPSLHGAITLDIEKLHADIREALPNDPISAAQLPAPSDPKFTLSPDSLLLLNDRIFVPDINNLRIRVLQTKHDHPLAGHFGQNKTLKLVRREYAWPGMHDFVKDYVNSCVICNRVKPRHHQPYGLLKQLPVPERPWNSISMDLIEKLPPSAGFTDILVIVDRLTKQAVFVPTHSDLTAVKLAELFVLNVFSKHGVPSHVTSEFVSHFFRGLGKALDIELHFTSGYHPEGDGQTERTNQTLEQYLRTYCNYQQDNWVTLLPLAEFAYNNAPHDATGVSPFFANKGYHPNLAECKSQKRYQKAADNRRLPAPNFKVGDQVFVKAQFFRTTRPSKKLAEKFLGPYEIIAQVGSHSFTLRLPQSMRLVHPVFHVSMLEPFKPSTIPSRAVEPPAPVEIEGELEYEVAEIVDSKIDRRRKCKLLYYVRWYGYENTDEEFSWQPADELPNAQELVQEFHEAYPNKPGPLPV
ncbi:unnamed protein product [Cyclocybe aegerita]|uniref:Uncharacterized protein n=1 Tax=Cyclocybe aegerita TaxID=1973307 RepID=A0A8S0VSJ0_CYCAE|nr:unnamed protein product [Cyclocybe aegerita]